MFVACAIFVFQNHQDIIVSNLMKFGKGGGGGEGGKNQPHYHCCIYHSSVVFAVLLEVRHLDSCRLSFSAHLDKCFSTVAVKVC